MLKLPFSSQMSLLCFLFVFYKGFMMYAEMELKYSSCSNLLVTLICSKKRQ